jgi:hypothetical protein
LAEGPLWLSSRRSLALLKIRHGKKSKLRVRCDGFDYQFSDAFGKGLSEAVEVCLGFHVEIGSLRTGFHVCLEKLLYNILQRID